MNCLEITQMNLRGEEQFKPILKFFLRGGLFLCLNMAAGYARESYREIDTALAELDPEVIAPPVSCAAMLARRLGSSEMQAVMAAGFAGGVGLSGGGCGALGAAIWISGLEEDQPPSNGQLTSPKVEALVEKFLKSSDYEFECAKIAGRRFENASDHADYLHQGGCAKIIEALAAR